MRKPGALGRYAYREDLFPTLVFRKAYDSLCSTGPGRKADLEYLRILHLAASTLESEVEAALALLLEAGQGISLERVKALVESQVRAEGPEMKPFEVDLCSYDTLLPTSMEVAS